MLLNLTLVQSTGTAINITPFTNGELVVLDAFLEIPMSLANTTRSIEILSKWELYENYHFEYSTFVGYTAFVPNDAAWLAHRFHAKLSFEDLGKAHIIPGEVLYSTNGAQDVGTEYGLPDISFDTHGWYTLYQDFSYVVADIPLDIGVMHIIDR